MQSAGLRGRMRKEASSGDASLEGFASAITLEEYDASLLPPKHQIDLSLPPSDRYKRLALIYKQRLQDMPALFDQVVLGANLRPRLTHRLARICLRRLRHVEETEELRGISEITGIKMYLLVAFNVLLDMFMGCTSGGVKIQQPGQGPKMVHFRTLDWGMDVLRRVIVQLDFVDTLRPQEGVIASTISYVGYVGVLTGVRKGLSVSLNFRPCHDSSSRFANFCFYSNHVLVLLGFRASVSSLLRQYLFSSPRMSRQDYSSRSSLSALEAQLSGTRTTAVYLILCDGAKAMVMEKDWAKATTIRSEDFVVATNHDVADEVDEERASVAYNERSSALQLIGIDDLVKESIHRKEFICDLWQTSLRRRRCRSKALGEGTNYTRISDVIGWMTKYPIANEETHYATVMDPSAGTIVWIRRYITAPSNEWTS